MQTTFIDSILDINVLNNYYNYKSILKENNRQNVKPCIKSLLYETIPDISFIRSPACNAPEPACTKQLQNIYVQKSFETSWDTYINIFNTPKMIRKDILAENV